MENKEIEVKFKIENIDDIIEKIKKVGGWGGDEIFQKTIRLDTPNDDLEKKGIFLRVRKEVADTMTVKIKNKHNDNFFEREEYEIKIEDADKAALMLKAVGFLKERILEKYRREFSFEKSDTHVVVDRLPFGNYIEIEGSTTEIEKMIESLSLDSKKRIINTYWDLWRDFSEKNGRDKENITFD